jgi:uncharacterized membrane protein
VSAPGTTGTARIAFSQPQAVGLATLAGLLTGAYLALPPNPDPESMLYWASASPALLLPLASLLILIPGRERVADAVIIALVIVVSAFPVLLARVWTNDYSTGSYSVGLSRIEVSLGFLVLGAVLALSYLIAAAAMFGMRERAGLARAGMALLGATAVSIVTAFGLYELFDTSLFYQGTNELFVPSVVGAAIAIALTFGIGTRLGIVAGPVAAWVTWMTVVLLHQRDFWNNDVSQGDLARDGVQYALLAALIATAAIGVVIAVGRMKEQSSHGDRGSQTKRTT